MREKPVMSFDSTDAQLIARPDKIEMFLQNSSQNRDVLPDKFPILAKKWTSEYSLKWRSQLDCRSREWLINGWNDHFRITFSGNMLNAIKNLDWTKNPFSREVLSEISDQHPYWHFGKIRITDKMKISPATYVGYISDIFRDIEVLGIQEMPRIIECATDIYGDAGPFYNFVRLAKDNPLDFCHFRGGDYHIGGSCGAIFTEYSMHKTFQPRRNDPFRRYNRYHRELVCYPRQEHGLFRIELRLGYRYLTPFLESDFYDTATKQCGLPLLMRDYPFLVESPTLDLLGLMPYFVGHQLKWEQIDLRKLNGDYPETRYWHLKGRSLRHIRYMLFKAGFSTKLVARYTLPVRPPSIRYVLPK